MLTFFRNHVREGQRKDQEGTLKELKQFTELMFLAGYYLGRLRSPYKCIRDEEEPPAVPRPHLRIRILTMVEQIAVKNDYEWEALELLKKQNFGHAKRFETRFLIKTGLKQDMNNALTVVGWKNFADIVELG